MNHEGVDAATGSTHHSALGVRFRCTSCIRVSNLKHFLFFLGHFRIRTRNLPRRDFSVFFVPGPFLPDQIKSSVEQVSSLRLRKVSSGSTFFCSPTFSKLRPTRFFPSQEVWAVICPSKYRPDQFRSHRCCKLLIHGFELNNGFAVKGSGPDFCRKSWGSYLVTNICGFRSAACFSNQRNKSFFTLVASLKLKLPISASPTLPVFELQLLFLYLSQSKLQALQWLV